MIDHDIYQEIVLFHDCCNAFSWHLHFRYLFFDKQVNLKVSTANQPNEWMKSGYKIYKIISWQITGSISPNREGEDYLPYFDYSSAARCLVELVYLLLQWPK